jgi:hypothetical protein
VLLPFGEAEHFGARLRTNHPRPACDVCGPIYGPVVELAYTAVFNTAAPGGDCGFEPHLGHTTSIVHTPTVVFNVILLSTALDTLHLSQASH